MISTTLSVAPCKPGLNFMNYKDMLDKRWKVVKIEEGDDHFMGCKAILL